MEEEELNMKGLNEKTLPLHKGCFRSKFSNICRKGAISKKKMDQDYNNHKKFWDHIRKITPTWKGRDEKDTKRRARSDGKEGDENEEGKDDNELQLGAVSISKNKICPKWICSNMQ